MKSIAFRCDASCELGIGHLMRCLTLADQLQMKGANVAFIASNLSINLRNLIGQKGYQYFDIGFNFQTWSQQADATASLEVINTCFSGRLDWIIVDHYQLDYLWEHSLREAADNVLVIDDLANRKHDCDLFLDQNYYKNMNERYEGLLPDRCLRLLGPNYLLLRDEFIQAREVMKLRNGSIGRILIFFGGSDPTNQTTKAIEAVISLNRTDLKVDVVVGSENPYKESIKKLCDSRPNFLYHYQINNMAALINAADMAIGAGGSAMWERCYLGLPSVTVTFADNQVDVTRDVAETGAIEYLGDTRNLDVETYAGKLRDFLKAPTLLTKMQDSAIRLVGTPQSTLIDEMWGDYTPVSPSALN